MGGRGRGPAGRRKSARFRKPHTDSFHQSRPKPERYEVLWGLLGVDEQRLSGLSRLQAARWRAGRVQRQIHERANGFARRIVRYAGARTSAQPTAISSPPRHDGSFPAFGWRLKAPAASNLKRIQLRAHERSSFPCPSSAIRRTRRHSGPRRTHFAAQTAARMVVLRSRRFAALRCDHRTARVLPDAHRARHIFPGFR